MSECVFCKIVGGSIVSPRVYENGGVIVINDANPVSRVHALIITKKHIKDVMSVGADDAGLLRDIQDAVLETAKIKGVDATGFRLVTNCGEDGGQSVPHLHYHIVGGRKLGEKIV